MKEIYHNPDVDEFKTKNELLGLEEEINESRTNRVESAKSNKEFGGVRLSYDGRYKVPGINQEKILSNTNYKSSFKDVPFSDCRLDIKPKKGHRMGTVVCGNASIGKKKKELIHKETSYSMAKLPGGRLEIPGRHVARDGTIRDKDGYICVAANYISKGSTIMTTLGPGKVYDTGGMTGKWIDIYTYWSDNQHWDEKRDWERCQKLCEEQVKKFEKRKEK